MRPYKQLSSGELEGKKKSKGLCYWCAKKYSTGHHCKMKQLFRLEVYADENLKTDRSVEEERSIEIELIEEEAVSPVKSLNALARIPSLANYNTLRVTSSVQAQKIHILIDSGNAHNFTNSFTVEKLKAKLPKILQ